MNALNARRSLALVVLPCVMVGLSMCGGKVVLDGDFSGSAGQGGGGASSASSSSAEVSVGAGLMGCTEGRCAGLGTQECSCAWTCSETALKVKCAPNENKKLQCVCSYEDVFSGACFENEVDLSCNIVKGCCAKYFLGK